MRSAVAFVVLAGLAGCREPPGPAPAPVESASPAASPASAAPAPPAPPSASATPPGPEADDGGRAAPVGGNWLRCYAQFQPRTRPDLDVLRLGMMCGPSNGMKKVSSDVDAHLAAGGAPREHRWQAEAGDCYRIFAVAEPGVEDLDVEVLDPAGKRIAFDTSDDRWPIVKPDGAFCVFQPGSHRAVVRAQRGSGKYAIEIWRLR